MIEQARHGDIAGSVRVQTTAIEHLNKASCNVFAGGGSCLGVDENSGSMKCNNRYGCILSNDYKVIPSS